MVLTFVHENHSIKSIKIRNHTMYVRPRLESARDDLRNVCFIVSVVIWMHKTGCRNGMITKQMKHDHTSKTIQFFESDLKTKVTTAATTKQIGIFIDIIIMEIISSVSSSLSFPLIFFVFMQTTQCKCYCSFNHFPRAHGKNCMIM